MKTNAPTLLGQNATQEVYGYFCKSSYGACNKTKQKTAFPRRFFVWIGGVAEDDSIM